MSDALVIEVPALVWILDDGAQISLEILKLGNLGLRSWHEVVLHHLNSSGSFFSELLHDIGFKLLSCANTPMGLELQIFVELFLLSHLFTFLLKFNFRRFIIDSIEIYVYTSGHILQPFRIHFLLTTSVNEAVWQCVQFRIGLLAFFLLLEALKSILCT